MNSTPVLIISPNAQRQKGKPAQMSVITAAKAVAEIVRTTLGPRAMLKMLLDANNSAVLTNDGACVLREIEAQHPAAKSIIELSRTQDERCGDGTTSVVVLAGELMSAARPFLAEGMHPARVVKAFRAAEEDCSAAFKAGCSPLALDDSERVQRLVAVTLSTKFTARFGALLPALATKAVLAVTRTDPGADVRALVKVEKIPGGAIEESAVLDGIMLNKDVLHAAMRRKIAAPKVLILECPLEYKKAESETNIEMKSSADWRRYLEIEENHVRELCRAIAALAPDVVVCEKGVSDLAQHFLLQANISVLRRARKSDLHRLALAVGARIAARPELASAADLGRGCGSFEVRKIGDEFWSFFERCAEPRAVTVLLRGASRDVLSEVERNLADAVGAVRNLFSDPRVAPGGGATELALAAHLRARAAQRAAEVELRPYLAAAGALEAIPKTLAENCGAKVARVMARLAALHKAAPAGAFCTMGVDGMSGEVADMAALDVWEAAVVKEQTVKTAFDAAAVLLRIDDILSGIKKAKGAPGPQGAQA